jgi:hypothetical protein
MLDFDRFEALIFDCCGTAPCSFYGFGATPEGRAEAEFKVPDLRSLVAAIDPTATV